MFDMTDYPCLPNDNQNDAETFEREHAADPFVESPEEETPKVEPVQLPPLVLVQKLMTLLENTPVDDRSWDAPAWREQRAKLIEEARTAAEPVTGEDAWDVRTVLELLKNVPAGAQYTQLGSNVYYTAANNREGIIHHIHTIHYGGSVTTNQVDVTEKYQQALDISTEEVPAIAKLLLHTYLEAKKQAEKEALQVDHPF